jgi:hypothetical protein
MIYPLQIHRITKRLNVVGSVKVQYNYIRTLTPSYYFPISLQNNSVGEMDVDGCDVDREGGSSPGSDETDLLIPNPDTRAQERLLVRKLDLRILPILCLLYLFACECNRSFFLVSGGTQPACT